jgi:hypothetical protein
MRARTKIPPAIPPPMAATGSDEGGDTSRRGAGVDKGGVDDDEVEEISEVDSESEVSSWGWGSAVAVVGEGEGEGVGGAG